VRTANCLFCWILFATPELAAAAPSGEANTSVAAQSLFDEGKKLMGANDFRRACAKLEESQRLDPALGTLLNLADCWEKSGRLASAWSTFVEVQGLASSAGKTNVEDVARQRAAELAPKLSRLSIDVDGKEAPGIIVRRDGREVGAVQWGTSIPMDGGIHTVTVTAPARKKWEKTFELAGSGQTFALRVPALEPEIVPVDTTAALLGRADAERSTGVGSTSRNTGAGFGLTRTIAVGVGGLGLAGVVVGAMFGLKSMNLRNEGNELCSDGRCATQAGVDVKEQAKTSGNVSTAAFIVGGACLGAGVVLWLTGKPGKTDQGSTLLTLGPSEIAVRGTF
jgi:hypothetical protein